MGGSSWSNSTYDDRVATRALHSTPTFIHTAAVASGKVAAGVHPTLDIKGKIREARDSAEHPNSNPIAVFFDETGSMAEVPGIMQKNLPGLMGLLLRKGYIEDPQILIGAIGDWTTPEKAPLQVGQFESGIEIDDNITHIYLEGNGGGQKRESYQNALYVLAHRTSCDAFEKRGKKGYAFLIGDEMAYEKSTRKELEELLGVSVEADVPLAQILEDAKQKWNLFFILPKGTNYYDDPQIEAFWKKHLGEHFIKLEDPAAVCEVIGSTIGIFEGAATSDTLGADLKDVGASDSIVATTVASVGHIANAAALARVGTGDGLPAAPAKSDSTERL